MDYGIKGKVALIGGSSAGLGLACAEALAREGARIVLCGRREKELQSAIHRVFKCSGSAVLGIRADLSEAEDVEKALYETQDSLGKIDILVTNTGGPRPGRFGDLEDEDWDRAYALLLKSAIGLIRGVLPGMRERGWGRIVGITSISVKEPIDTLLLSNVFRSGVTSLFKSLSREAAADGVTINTVAPGLTDTERLKQLYASQAESQGLKFKPFMEGIAQGLPLGRLNRPEELGALVAFLCSEAASGITGAAIGVDGGQIKGLF